MTMVAFIKTNDTTLATGEILLKRPHFEAFCECEITVLYTTGKERGSAKAYALTDLMLHVVDKDRVKIVFKDKTPIDATLIREYQYDEPESMAIEVEQPRLLVDVPRFNIVSDLNSEYSVTLPYEARVCIAQYVCGLFNTATFKRRMTRMNFKVVSLITRGKREEGMPYAIFRHRLSQLAVISDGKNAMQVYL